MAKEAMSYTIAQRVENINDSVTLALTARCKEMTAAGEDMVNFGAGEPDFDTPSVIREAAKKAIDTGQTRYTHASGTPQLRRAICDKLAADNGLCYSPEQVVVSNGAKHSLYNVIQTVCSPGDEVIVPAPYWLTYPEQVKSAGGVPLIVQTSPQNDWKITPRQLSDAITPRTVLVILNSPSNPTGMVYAKDELAELANVIVERDILVVSDEVYEKLVFGKARHHSIAAAGREMFERTVVVNGVSKTYAMTGWRIGYAAGPAPIMAAAARLQSHATSNPCSVAQAAAVAAITGDQSEARRMRAAFEERRNLVVKRVAAVRGLSMTTPDGAFYAFIDVTKFIARGFASDSESFCRRCLEEIKVVLIPGSVFGAEGFVRLSYAVSVGEINKGLGRLEGLLEGRCKDRRGS